MSTQSLQRDSQTKDFRFRVESGGKQSSGEANVNPPEPSIGGSDSDSSSPTASPWDQQLAIPRRSMRIRADCLTETKEHESGYEVIDPRPITWSEALEGESDRAGGFKKYLLNQRNYANAPWCDLDHRFTRKWCAKRFAGLAGVDRWCQEHFDDPHSVSLTLNGHNWNSAGEFRCPLDHLNELLQSNSKVGQRLRYHIDCRYVGLMALGAHKHGYAHAHWFFITEGDPGREPFERALHTHLGNSPIARKQDHPTDDPEHRTIRVEPIDPDPQYDRSGNNKPLTRITHEASSQLCWPEDDGIDVLDAPAYQQRFATLLWAAHYIRQWRTSGMFDEICEQVQTDYAKDHGDESQDDGTETDWDELDDPVEPTVEIEASAWPSDVDPVAA